MNGDAVGCWLVVMHGGSYWRWVVLVVVLPPLPRCTEVDYALYLVPPCSVMVIMDDDATVIVSVLRWNGLVL